MIVLMGRDGSIIAEYSGLSDGAGYPPGSSTGRLGLEFVHPDDPDAAASTFDEVLSKPGLIQSFQCRIRHGEATWRRVESVADNLLDYRGQAIVISAYDITDKKTLEQSIAGANKDRADITSLPRRRSRRNPGPASGVASAGDPGQAASQESVHHQLPKVGFVIPG